MENNILTTHFSNRIYYHTKFSKIDDLHDEIEELLENQSFPDFVRQTYSLLKQKDDKLRNMIQPIEDSFKQFTQLKNAEDELNRQIILIDTALQKIIQGRNEINKRHIQEPSLTRGGSKKIYTKREHKRPTKEKTTIKKISRTIKSSKLKTTKKK